MLARGRIAADRFEGPRAGFVAVGMAIAIA
jgi:hypothetical protein